MARLLYDRCQSVLTVSVSPPRAVFPVVLPEILDERPTDIVIHAARRKSQHLLEIGWISVSSLRWTG